MKAVRVGILVLVTFTVLAHGAVEGWSEAVLEVGAALLFLLWGVLVVTGRQAVLRGSPLLWPLLAFAGFVLMQYLVRLTVYPYLTKIELLKLMAFVLLFFLAVQAFRTLREWHNFVWFLLTLAFCVSVFAIIQHFTFNGKLYWIRELRFGGVPFGPYVNRNHFAGLIEVLVPPGLAILVLRAARRDLLPLAALFTVLPIGALFLSASRGGIVGFLVEVGVVVLLALRRRGARRSLATGAVVVGLLAAALVGWLGVGAALERFAKFQSLEVSEARRLEMLKGSWRIFLDHPLAGTGLGTLISVYPKYETLYDGKIVNHTHNDYLEALAETGVVGAACCAAFLFLLFRVSFAQLRLSLHPLEFAIRAGALAACVGLLAHGVADFNLHIPSNALLFFLQAALATAEIPAAVAAS